MLPGVLSLQGGVDAHLSAFEQCGVPARTVRRPGELEGLTHLVVPGGESTTLHHLMQLFGLWNAIDERCRRGQLALFGTCAGAVLLGRPSPERPPRWGLLDVEVHRNAYGRQVDSRVARLPIEGLGRTLDCVFIRAPKLGEVGPGVRVLAREAGEAIAVEAPGLLATTFHPELAGDPCLHRHFLERIGPGKGTVPPCARSAWPTRPRTPSAAT